MVKVTLAEVKEVFQMVLDGRMAREVADRWAFKLVRAADSQDLSFDPDNEREKIWAGIMYLYGIDSMEDPGVYLHTADDIRKAYDEKLS